MSPQGISIMGFCRTCLLLFLQFSPGLASVINIQNRARGNSSHSLSPVMRVYSSDLSPNNFTATFTVSEAIHTSITAADIPYVTLYVVPHKDSFLLSNTKCWGSNGLHTRCEHLGAFDDVPPPPFDPFGDLHEDDMTPFHDPEIEKRFFEVTEENIETSNVKVWYARWTENQKNTPRWAEIGEWPFFMEYFTGNSNFQCHIGSPCQELPTPEQLARRFPKNPKLVRRIFFVGRFYKDWNNLNSGIDRAYLESNDWMMGQIPNIVRRFSQETNQSKAALCKIYHVMTNFQNTFPMMLVSSIFAAGFLTPYVTEGRRISELLAGVKEPTTEIQLNYTGVNPKEQSPIQMHFDLNQWLLNGQFSTPLGQKSEWKKYLEGTPVSDLSEGLDPGKAADSICSKFEGGYEIDITGNIEKLGEKLSTHVGKLHEDLRKIYRDLYWGKNIGDGQISGAAAVFATQKWRGDGSVWNSVDHTEPWIAEMKLIMFMQFASAVGASNYQYVKCTTSSKAKDRCDKAAEDAQKCRDEKGINCDQNIFCPRPEHQPHVICSAHRWQLDDTYSGEKDLPWLKSFNTVFKDETNPIFKSITVQDMLKSSWNFYESYGLFSDGNLASGGDVAGGYHLPVCYAEGLDVDDHKFPSGCGHDYRATETRAFMDRLHLGMGTDAWARRFKTVGNELYNNRIPQTLDYKFPQAVSPISNYLTLCELNLRLSRSDKDKWPAENLDQIKLLHQEEDPSCGMVREATAEMNQHDANQWFCETGEQDHKVFRYEMDTAFMRTHKSRCEDWKKGRIPTGVKFDPEDLDLWYESARP